MLNKLTKIAFAFLLFSSLYVPSNGASAESILDEEIDELQEENETIISDGVEEQEENDENVEFLGPQVYQTSALTASVGTDEAGNTYMYFIMHGTPSALAVVDLNSNELLNTYTLEHSTSAWGIDVDVDGTVWVGGTTSGHLYSYDPNSEEFIDHGDMLGLPKDTAIQDIKVHEGIVFGSTAYGGNVFKYDSNTGEHMNFGQISHRKEFAKSLGYDHENEALFIGVGSKADLIRMDLKTKVKKSFLPNEYKEDKYIRGIQFIDDLLFARMDPSKQVVIFDRHSLELIADLEVHSREVSQKSPYEDAIYYSKDQSIHKYDLTTQEETNLNISLLPGTELLTLDIVQLIDPNFPGFTLVGLLDNDGNVLKYNLDTEYVEITKVALPPQPVTLYTMVNDEKGENIFINGYMSGGLAIYNTKTNTSRLFQEISQIESMSVKNQYLYIGAYPLSRVLVLDLEKPWGVGNPRTIMRLGNYGQSRATAITSHERSNQLFVGTYPETSIGGGALAVYDLKTDQYEVFDNFIYNQSIISLHSNKDYVYGGTSIHANYMVNNRGARFFRFSPEYPNKIEYIHLPINASMITSIIEDRDGVIWAMADGHLISYDPRSKEIRTKQILELISGRFRNANILIGADGYIYGTVEGKLFKASRETLEIEILKSSGAYEISTDFEGNLYFRNEADLLKYKIFQ